MTAEALKKAKALIPDEQHWWHGQLINDTRYCPLLAILDQRRRGDSTTLFREAIQCSSISEWNDAPERTLAEVHAAFDRAIALAESRGL